MVSYPPVGLTSRGTLIGSTSAVLLALVMVTPAVAETPVPVHNSATRGGMATADDRLLALFRTVARRADGLDPLEVLYRGRKPDTSVFAALFSSTHSRAEQAIITQALADLLSIDRAQLSPERQLSYDAFRLDQQIERAGFTPEFARLRAAVPITHFGGLHAEFPGLVASSGPLPYRSEADYRRNLALLQAWPVVVENIIARFREGLTSGVTEHAAPVRNMIAQLDAIIAAEGASSPFLSPLGKFPKELDEPQRTALRQAYTAAAQQQVYPAYRKLRAFLAQDYLPQARAKPGIDSLPGGAAYYRHLIERRTTLKLDPEEIHALGQTEVARIQREMEGVARQLGFKGNLRAFFEQLRTNPKYHPRSAEELRSGYQAVARKVDRQLPRLFLHSPRTRLTIAPYPAYLERFEAGGSYEEGSADQGRAGIFYFNTFDLPSRYLTGVTTLYLHEGAPGHHFQISLAQENRTLPKFQRNGGNSAFVEGWALYAETLGFEMGLYTDPLQHWGTLDDEMLRAMRLVVDTGLHAKGWSREQAVAYMLGNSGMGRSDAEAEVDRYIAQPAQALSYKLGALTIQRLRAKAERALGQRFDLRQFHDQVLGSGALPLPVLEAKIDRWIAAQGRK
jgi:uncharacterized protein (DUF885 family)